MVKMSYYADYSDYTDFHGVDEDLRTVTNQGGWWGEESLVGIVYRFMFDSSSYAAVDVASRYHTNRTIQTKK